MQLAGEQKKLIADFSHGMQKKLALAAAVIHGPKVLFLDEPFEGVDAVAAGTLKAMLLRMIARGATIFLTSHVLEIVERLCTHIAIIHRGQLVAQGSLDELRAGAGSSGQAEIQEGAALAGAEKSSTEKASLDKRSLEQIFLAIVGTDRDGNPAATASEQELSWLS
jgi:ABC-2 type transport system ATP-binding protein